MASWTAGHEAPTRTRRYSWKTFIRAHLEAIATADFFTVEVMSLVGLVRTYVFFVIDLASRKVEIAGICRQPDELWMDQMARNLLDSVDGFLVRCRIRECRAESIACRNEASGRIR